MKYQICPKCGSHLDHGERCDCEERREREAAKLGADLAAKPASTDERRPVLTLMPGA